jgi:hypothetical protein
MQWHKAQTFLDENMWFLDWIRSEVHLHGHLHNDDLIKPHFESDVKYARYRPFENLNLNKRPWTERHELREKGHEYGDEYLAVDHKLVFTMFFHTANGEPRGQNYSLSDSGFVQPKTIGERLHNIADGNPLIKFDTIVKTVRHSIKCADWNKPVLFIYEIYNVPENFEL